MWVWEPQGWNSNLWLRVVVVFVSRSEAQRKGLVTVNRRGGPGSSDLQLRDPANWR